MLNHKLHRKLAITIIFIFGVLLSHLSCLDSLAENYTEQGIKRTLVTYAVSRSLNSVISVAQGTEVAVSPAGMGVTFAPGQILDPVNDLIERFSWVVMVSGASLGIQRLFLEISSSQLLVWSLSFLSLIFIIVLWINKGNSIQSWHPYLKRTLVVFVFMRFSVPMIALSNEALYITYLQPQYEVAQLKLETTSSEIKIINESSKQDVQRSENKGVFDKVEKWLDQTKKNLDISTQMNSLKQVAADISEQVINMIVVFVVQTILIPLLFLWLLIKSAKIIMHRVSL